MTTPTSKKRTDEPAHAEGQDASEDLALVERCQAGDRQAFDELVTKYRNKVFGIAYNMTRREEESWDIAQDVFFKAWKSIRNFRQQSAFFTWLYRIVMNVTIDALRKRQGEEGAEFDETIAMENVDPSSGTTPAPAELPDRKLEQEEIRIQINQAILKLSSEHREVIVLREIDGLEYHEIAERTGTQIGTVMSRLFYARKKLQTLLRNVYEQL